MLFNTLCSGVFDGRSFNVDLNTIRPLKPNENVCGVYAASGINLHLGKEPCLYIGSSKDIFDRFKNGHLYLLSKGKHHSPNFQKIVNYGGIDNLQIFLLEQTSIENRFKREQNWLDFYNSKTESLGYKPILNYCNSVDQESHELFIVETARQKRAKEYIITFPDGHEEVHRNLVDFCKIYNLHRASLAKTVTGIQKEHRGFKARYITDNKNRYIDNTWKLKNNKKAIDASKEYTAKEYLVIYPDGKEERIKNLKEFCKLNNIGYGGAVRCAVGKLKTHHGLKFVGLSSPKRKYTLVAKFDGKEYTIKFPNGDIKIIKNLKKFCKDFNLTYSCMCSVANKRTKSHQGFEILNKKD